MNMNKKFANKKFMNKKKSLYAAAMLMAAVSLTACGGTGGSGKGEPSSAVESTQAVEVDLEKVHQAVKDVYGENYIPSAPYDAQALNDLFGVSEDLYEEFIAEGPMISVHVDTFAAIKAKEGKGGDVEKLLNDYRTRLVEDSLQYPMNMSKVEASEVVRHGDYVFFVMLGTASNESVEAGEEAELKSAQEENGKAIDAIDAFFEG